MRTKCAPGPSNAVGRRRKRPGVVHTDMERGFIRAEVVPFAVFEQHQDRNAIKSAGLLQVEGRDYVVGDGDVILFRFNV